MRLAVILVHFHTPHLAAAAVEALRSDLAGSGLAPTDIDWLLVDNGSDAEERTVLESLPVRRIDPGANLGYAAGANLGIAESRAETILLLNPDVLVLPGCVPALLESLREGAAIAGPRSYWDTGRRMVLPPAEPRSRRDELYSLLAGRNARRRWRQHARRHWQARNPLPSYDLSGSLLVFQRSAVEKAGPFDEGFRLYFEETDWLLRVRRLGLPAWYVPAAEAVHLYNQSAGREPRAQAWFEESARRFRRLHYGAGFTAALEALDRGLPRRSSGLIGAPGSRTVDLTPFQGRFPLWIEVSPNQTGFPAAAELLPEAPDGPWSLPAEIDERLAPGNLTLQVTDAAGYEIVRRLLPCGAA